MRGAREAELRLNENMLPLKQVELSKGLMQGIHRNASIIGEHYIITDHEASGRGIEIPEGFFRYHDPETGKLRRGAGWRLRLSRLRLPNLQSKDPILTDVVRLQRDIKRGYENYLKSNGLRDSPGHYLSFYLRVLHEYGNALDAFVERLNGLAGYSNYVPRA